MSGTTRRYAILDAFRRCNGFLTPAELAVPEVGGTTWRWEMGEMRKLGYDLHETADGWHLVDDPKIRDPEPPAAFDFSRALRAMTARGRALDASKGAAATVHPRVANFGEVRGHVARIAPGALCCAGCGEPWTDALLTHACQGARRATAA